METPCRKSCSTVRPLVSALARGVARLAAAVEPTLGPKGMNAMIDRPIGTPIITRDGVSIAAEIELPERFENMGAQVVREVSMQTNAVAGDGTTTAIVLANALVQAERQALDRGAKTIDLCRGIDLAVESVLAGLKASARTATDEATLASVATVAATEPKLGALVAEAFAQVGEKGVITTEFSLTTETTLDVRRGHGVRPRLPLASHGDRPGDDDGGARAAADPDDGLEDQGPGVARRGARRREPGGAAAAGHRRRGLAGGCRQPARRRGGGPLSHRPSARVRPLAQGAARGHGDSDRRAGDRPRSRRTYRGRHGGRSRRRRASEDDRQPYRDPARRGRRRRDPAPGAPRFSASTTMPRPTSSRTSCANGWPNSAAARRSSMPAG